MRKLLPRLNAFCVRQHSIEVGISSTSDYGFTPFSPHQQRQASTRNDVSTDDARRIYVQGTGPLSLFIAHSIASRPNPPPVTILTYTNRRLLSFNDIGRKITIICDGKSYETGGVSVEVVPMPHFRVVPIRPGAKNFMIRALRLNPEGDLIHDETNPGGDLMLNEPSTTKATLASPNISTFNLGTPSGTLSPSAIPDRRLMFLPSKSPRYSRGVIRTQNSPAHALNVEIMDVRKASHLPPIFNLILTTKSAHVKASLDPIRHRFRRDSTLIFLQKGMGILPQLYEGIFKNTQTRPNCLNARHSYHLLEAASWTTEFRVKGIKGSQKDVLAGRRINYEDWHILWDGEGSLRIGPLAIIEGSETRESEARRQRTSRYLIETLRSCHALNAHEIDAATITFERCKALAVEAILGPVSALLECTYGEIEAGIMDDPSTRELVKRLFTETWEVFNQDIQSIRKENLLKWLSVKMSRDADMSSTMVQHMLVGRCSELDWINGWIVKRGKQHE